MSTQFQSVEDFLNYKEREGGDRGRRLKAWARDKGYLNFWLHTKQFPCAVWYHRLPEMVVRQDKNDQSRTMKNVWPRQHVCWEDDAVLKKQYFREDDGSRKHPPLRCGICRMNDAIRAMIVSGELKDTDPLFEWKGSDKPEENIVLHAGGVCSFWSRNDLQDAATKTRLAAAGLYVGNSPGRPGLWAESSVAKLSYVFVGVDQDDVAAGVQVAVQTKDVGEKVKSTINKEIASDEGDLGNPFVHPYCIQVLYKPEEPEFGKKYDALRIRKFKMTPEIERLIRGDKPDLSRYTSKFNAATIRAQLEKHCLRKLPWDSIFDVPANGEPEEPPPVRTPTPAKSAQVPVAYGDPCEDCGAPMKVEDTKCGRCGTVYEVTPEPKAATPVPAQPREEAYEEESEIPF